MTARRTMGRVGFLGVGIVFVSIYRPSPRCLASEMPNAVNVVIRMLLPSVSPARKEDAEEETKKSNKCRHGYADDRTCVLRKAGIQA